MDKEDLFKLLAKLYTNNQLRNTYDEFHNIRKDGLGNCYDIAASLFVDFTLAGIKAIWKTGNITINDKTYEHNWVEIEDFTLDFSGQKERIYKTSDFYFWMHVEDIFDNPKMTELILKIKEAKNVKQI